MDFPSEPHRCPKCNALVVDRRSPVCTTCHEALPADWVMTQEQISKVEAFDQDAKAEYASAMKQLDSVKSSSEITNP